MNRKLSFIGSVIMVLAISSNSYKTTQAEVLLDGNLNSTVSGNGVLVNEVKGNGTMTGYNAVEQRTEIDNREMTKDKIVSLQIPQTIDIVIDPWEIDGKQQIYSEQYTIRNCGETRGILILSDIVCVSQKEGVTVQKDTYGLHEGGEKKLYLEMVSGEESIVLSGEKSRYEWQMEPGEELFFYFTGEVNENALEEWKEDDVNVTILYSWSQGSKIDIRDAVEKGEN